MGCGVVPACGVVERVPGFAALLATQTGAVDLHAFLVPCLQPGARHVVCAEAWVPQACLKPGAGHEERVREVATPLVATTAACPTSPPGGRKPLERRQAGRGLSAAGARLQGAERRSGKERRKRCLQTYLQVQLWEARAAARTGCTKRARAAARDGQAAGPRKPAPGWQCIKCFASVTIFRDLPAYTAHRDDIQRVLNATTFSLHTVLFPAPCNARRLPAAARAVATQSMAHQLVSPHHLGPLAMLVKLTARGSRPGVANEAFQMGLLPQRPPCSGGLGVSNSPRHEQPDRRAWALKWARLQARLLLSKVSCGGELSQQHSSLCTQATGPSCMRPCWSNAFPNGTLQARSATARSRPPHPPRRQAAGKPGSRARQQ